jgi:LuxR family maltose regulon positive regulatory protein
MRPPLLDTAALLEQLDAGMSHLLTLLVAPTGYGKSALLHRWVAAHDWPVIWIALEVCDNDLTCFVQHLITASEAIVPGIPWLRAGEALTVQDCLTEWLNALAGLEGDFVLILDGYERIEAPAVHEAVVRMLDHPPPHLHLFIAARAEPPLQLPRLRVRRQLLQVRLMGESNRG